MRRTRPRPGWRLCALLSVLLAAAHPLPGAGEAWIGFPEGFVSGASGRLRLELGGQPVSLSLDPGPSWDESGAHEVDVAPGILLRFQKPGAGRPWGGITARVLARGGGDLEARVEAVFTRLGGASPARFGPRGSQDVAFLGLGGGGGEVARGLFDPRANRGIDLGIVDESLELNLERLPDGAGAAVVVAGRVPRGRDVAIFAWREVASLFPSVTASTRVERQAGALSGWSLEDGAGPARAAEKLLASGLVPCGAYLEIGDGWQGKRPRFGGGSSRKWLAAAEDGAGDPSMPGGLASDLARLEELGFRHGLWIVPHGEGDADLFRNRPQAFVRDKRGDPVPGGLLGPYVIDGTSADGAAHLADLFGILRARGASVFRLALLGEALRFYARERESLADPAQEPVEVLRRTLAAIRDGAGGGAVLAGDWDTPPELTGLLDAARPAVPDKDGVESLEREGLAAAGGYWRHRSAWWAECFPVTAWAHGASDVERREHDQSRILFAALTGRGLLVAPSKDAPPWTPGLLRASEPGADVAPIDLFAMEGLPRIWDLKTSGGSDLAGVFNWSALESAMISFSPRDLGIRLEKGESLIFFDAVREVYAGMGSGMREVFLLAGQSRLLVIRRALERPQVMARSGGFLASASGVADVEWDAVRRELSGRLLCSARKGEPGEVRVHIAHAPRWTASSAVGDGAPLLHSSSSGGTTLHLSPAGAAEASFRVAFTEAPEPPPAPAAARPSPSAVIAPPAKVRVSHDERERGPVIEWQGGADGPEWWRNVEGFAVLRDGIEAGRTRDMVFLDRGAIPGSSPVYTVAALIGSGGRGGMPDPARSAESAPVTFHFPEICESYIDGWSVASSRTPRGRPARMRSATGGPISIGGRRFERGIGTRAPSRIEYRLDGLPARFEASVGVDDAGQLQGSVVFVVEVDGEERYRGSRILGGAEPTAVSVFIGGGRLLALVVEDGGDGSDGDLADWADARVQHP
ncbi:MAG TPA: NPCBM/NEW2 domain-containing protein [Planctomycetota bacterium]|nr:NPCBM/NEW2 domain-containing protein [Planctomycetota bacterium]